MGYSGAFTINDDVSKFLNREPAHFLDGAFQSSGGDTIPVFDPSSGVEIARVANATADEVDRAVQSAHRAFVDGRWRHLRAADRERILMKFADLIEQNGESLAQMETLEQGKSIHISRMIEVSGSVDWARYAAGLTTKLTGDTMEPSLPGGPLHWTAFTRREPVGVVAGISPWNFPMAIGLWKVLPALAAGCSVVLKPTEVAPLTALWLAELAVEAGLPEGVFNVVTGTGAVAGAALVQHPLIAKISFTGSTATGKAIARAAADGLKRVSLELGGKNPAIILADSDLDKVVQGLVIGGFTNQGQVCAAASRVYVEAALYDKLVDALGAILKDMPVGAGLDPAAQVNPLASAAHQHKVRRYLDDARDQGAEIISGAKTPDDGYFISPTLVLNPSDTLALKREEMFGPVLGVTRVKDADEAVALANDSELGLSASLWTNDLTKAMTLVPRIEAGTVWVNSHLMIDPAMPFGGFKQSGTGREFGPNWLHGFTEEKTICIAH